MRIRQESGHQERTTLAALALAAMLAALGVGGCTRVHADREPAAASRQAAGAARDEAARSAGWIAPWHEPELVGEEGALVEVIYEDGWVLVGERVSGVPIYAAPQFEVPARKVEDVPMFPCMDCHAKHETDYRRRKLKREHTNIELRHGGRDFWCTECHNGRHMNQLVSTAQKPIDMDLGYLLCGQCHFRQLKDWHYGGHGKRIGMWQGPRVLRTCPECHNPHAPAIAPFDPVPAPTLREGLRQAVRMESASGHGTAKWLQAEAR